MDLSFKPEYEDFRKEVIEFLDSELTSELREAGKLTASVFSEVEYSSKWHKILHKKGWIGGTLVGVRKRLKTLEKKNIRSCLNYDRKYL